ncbi:MAG TPA: outer membrane protein assembly factor BamA, partial [Polyangiaceae bacterium]|nr:outer membrane protein assembly factor BamA [Polyangiaceae bacterium]
MLVACLVLVGARPLAAQPAAPPADETAAPEDSPPPPEKPKDDPSTRGGKRPPQAPGPPAIADLPKLPPTEAEKARGKRIEEVRIVGNRRIGKDEVGSYLKWLRKGKAFNPRGMTRDVRELWDTAYFEDIEVDLTQTTDTVRLRLLVRERPSIKEVKFEGNKELDDDDLTEIATKEVKVGSIISHAAIRRAVQKIRDKYAEEGYFLAEANYEVVPRKDNQVLIRFTVKEHEKVTVRRVTFIGNHSVP